MVETIAELKKLSDDELVRRHDEKATATVVGTAHYLEELRSRENARLSQSVERMTKYILWLTCVMAIATLVQLFLAFRLI